MRKLYIIATALAALCISANASAQALPFVASDHSAASMAKGSASYTDISNTSYAAFQSPAAMTFSQETMEISFEYMLWQPSQVKTNIINAAGMLKLKDKFGIAAGVSYGMSPLYNITDIYGNTSKTFRPVQKEFSAGFSWRFHKNISIGTNVGYANSKLTEDVSYSAVVADIQTMAVFGNLKASLGISDLGTDITSASGLKFSLPTSVNLAAGYNIVLADKHCLCADAVAQYYFTQDFAAALGASYTYNGILSFRTGYRYGGDSVIPSFASVGAGVKVGGIKIDFAYLFGSKVLTNSMCISVGYSF